MVKLNKQVSRGQDRPVPTKWNHLWVVYMAVDQGTRTLSPQYPPARVIEIGFEIPGETAEFDGEEKPLAVRATFTIGETFSPRSRFGLLVGALLGDEFVENISSKWGEIKPEDFIGKAATILVAHKNSKTKDWQEKTYCVIEAVTPVMKGMEAPALVNEPIVFDLEKPLEGENLAAFDSMPDWKKELISKTPEYQEAVKASIGSEPSEDIEEDIPF